MATLILTLQPEIIEAARLEAERRQISIDQLIKDYLLGLAHPEITPQDRSALVRLMYEGRMGTVDKPLTREEIYAERTWPRS